MVLCVVWSVSLQTLNGQDYDIQPNMMPFMQLTPAPTISLETRKCRMDCGDGYYTCAVIKCERLGPNETESTSKVKETENDEVQVHDSTDSETLHVKETEDGNAAGVKRSEDREIDECWMQCREHFKTCYDQCKPQCIGADCPTMTTEYTFDWNTIT